MASRMRGLAACALALSALATSASRATDNLIGDPIRGKFLYQGCSGCHSIDDDDIGPKHGGVVGRAAGSVATFAYSAALKNSGLIWDETMLDRWLTNSSVLVPGTKMYFKIDDPQSRADIITYLKQLK